MSENKTLTINLNNHLALCRIKLDMQEVIRNKKRIDFNDVLAYLMLLHEKHKKELKLYAMTMIDEG